MAIIGVGDLGHAIAHYRGFKARGFRVAALFDTDPTKIGEQVNDLTVLSMDRLQDEIRKQGIKVAMVAVPLEAAQAVTNQLVQVGVRAILNYAPITLAVPPGVYVQYIDPVAHLQHMTYYL
jgi:redox-sensing transcriptional repressor